MASIAGVYNQDTEPSNRGGDYEPLPDGFYDLEVVESDYGTNSKGNGMNLKMKAQVVGGDFAERIVYMNFGLEHDNAGWAAGEQSRFAAFRHAVGVLAADDTEEFHFKAFRAHVKVELNKSTGKLGNVVDEYLWGEEAAATQAAEPKPVAAARPAARPAAAQPAARTKPWK